jgi:DNA-binding MarR family transcriptional regulator
VSSYERRATILRAVSHPLRLRALELLDCVGESTARDLSRELNVPLPTTAYHLRELISAGVVQRTRSVARRGALAHVCSLTAEGERALKASRSL